MAHLKAPKSAKDWDAWTVLAAAQGISLLFPWMLQASGAFRFPKVTGFQPGCFDCQFGGFSSTVTQLLIIFQGNTSILNVHQPKESSIALGTLHLQIWNLMWTMMRNMIWNLIWHHDFRSPGQSGVVTCITKPLPSSSQAMIPLPQRRVFEEQGGTMEEDAWMKIVGAMRNLSKQGVFVSKNCEQTQRVLKVGLQVPTWNTSKCNDAKMCLDFLVLLRFQFF